MPFFVVGLGAGGTAAAKGAGATGKFEPGKPTGGGALANPGAPEGKLGGGRLKPKDGAGPGGNCDMLKKNAKNKNTAGLFCLKF